MSTTIRAAVLAEVDGPFVFEDAELGDIAPGELLVRIVATGLCHTDLAVRHGDIPSPFPVVLGHEGAGVVEQVGDDAVGFAPGDAVALSYASCGHCVNCLEGREAYCTRFMALNFGGRREDGTTTMRRRGGGGELFGSFFGQSSFATHAVVAARNAVRVPDGVPLELVGPLGCGIQTGAGTVLNTLDVRAGSSVVVAGTGAVGLSAIMAAKVAAATTIIAVDVLPERLAVARELGATHTVDGRASDVVEQIVAATGGAGAAYAVDTTAVPAVMANLLQATRNGASLAFVGVGRPDATLPAALLGGKRIIGAIEGDAVPQTFIPELISLYRAGAFPFDRLVTTYAFEDIDRAIEDTRSGAAVKAVLTMS